MEKFAAARKHIYGFQAGDYVRDIDDGQVYVFEELDLETLGYLCGAVRAPGDPDATVIDVFQIEKITQAEYWAGYTAVIDDEKLDLHNYDEQHEPLPKVVGRRSSFGWQVTVPDGDDPEFLIASPRRFTTREEAWDDLDSTIYSMQDLVMRDWWRRAELRPGAWEIRRAVDPHFRALSAAVAERFRDAEAMLAR